MAFFKWTDGTVIGTLRQAQYKPAEGNFKEGVILIGQWDGQPGDRFQVSMSVAERLTQAGFLGLNDEQTAYWVDSSRKLALNRTGSGPATRYELYDCEQYPDLAPDIQQASGSSAPKPSNAAPRPQQGQRPPQGGKPPAPAGKPPQGQQKAPQQRHQEDPESQRRRVRATYGEALRQAYELLTEMKATGLDIGMDSVQAAAATLMIRWEKEGIPLLPDPKAPPKLTDTQVSELKELRSVAEKLGYDKAWFASEVGKHGPPTSLNTEQAKAAILAITGILVKRETEIREAAAREAARQQNAQAAWDPSDGPGDPNDPNFIPF